ncbi:MAG: DUF4177 domain-containing protein, partial [Sediminibacterium sp.]|nr:DUF4177 domain-containing protein [Sediminibacterium sp.]
LLSMDKFEYKILNINMYSLKKESIQADLMNQLNSLGNEGWEVINMEGIIESGYFLRLTETTKLLIILKRKISQ